MLTEPIVFISHHRIEPGRGDDLHRFTAESSPQLEQDKPRTAFFATYFDEGSSQASFVHHAG